MDAENTIHDYDQIIIDITVWMQTTLSSIGVPQQWITLVKTIVLIAIVAISAFILQWVVRKILSFVFLRIEKLTPLSFFKYTEKNKLPHFLALIVPYSFVRGAIPIIFYDTKLFISPCIKIVDICVIFITISIIMAIIKSCFNVIQERPAFANKPMKSYIQVIQIILFIFGAVGVFSIITGKSATAIFATMGAASAVMMLLFKDSIMGFVGSIQISTNNMVQLGDWITLSKFGADGTVEEINLTTVKVRNFDKTITTIPTYSLISDSFQNWRGMQESGGRRIKKALFVKQTDIRMLTNEELEKYKKVDGLNEFIDSRLKTYAERDKHTDKSIAINGSWITNNDLFMQYAINYLQHHPRINTSLTLMVRQLAPTTQGLPIEIYTFTNTTVWAEYETIGTEIINHLISAVSFFDLRIHEDSAGSDGYNVYMHPSKDSK